MVLGYFTTLSILGLKGAIENIEKIKSLKNVLKNHGTSLYRTTLLLLLPPPFPFSDKTIPFYKVRVNHQTVNGGLRRIIPLIYSIVIGDFVSYK